MRKRYTLAALAGLAAFTAVAASAASLGGLTAQSLGADATVVASCDSDGVGLSYGTPAYDAASGEYKISSVQLTGVAAGCNGKQAAVTLTDADKASLAQSSAAVAGTTVTITFSSAVAADDITGAAAVISG